MRDVIIIGSGIAACTAAIYASRASLSTLVISGPELDQLSMTSIVENFPGFPDGIMGPELVTQCKAQAKKFGTEFLEGKADSFSKSGKNFIVGIGKKKLETKSVIIATGAFARKTGIPGEDKYFGRGVATCAVCDAALYQGKIVTVIGGGDAAMEESLALYKFASKVKIIHRRDTFRASKIMQNRVLKLKDKIEVLWDTVPLEVVGDGKFVRGLKVKNVKTSKEKEITCDGVFLAIGHIPNTSIFSKFLTLDEHGYIITDKFGKTNVEGIYAAGDCQDAVFMQAVTSAGTGCMASINAERYIEKLKAKGEY